MRLRYISRARGERRREFARIYHEMEANNCIFLSDLRNLRHPRSTLRSMPKRVRDIRLRSTKFDSARDGYLHVRGFRTAAFSHALLSGGSVFGISERFAYTKSVFGSSRFSKLLEYTRNRRREASSLGEEVTLDGDEARQKIGAAPAQAPSLLYCPAITHSEQRQPQLGSVERAAPCSEPASPTHLTPSPFFPTGWGCCALPSSHSAGRLFHEVMTYDWTTRDDAEGFWGVIAKSTGTAATPPCKWAGRGGRGPRGLDKQAPGLQ